MKSVILFSLLCFIASCNFKEIKDKNADSAIPPIVPSASPTPTQTPTVQPTPPTGGQDQGDDDDDKDDENCKGDDDDDYGDSGDDDYAWSYRDWNRTWFYEMDRKSLEKTPKTYGKTFLKHDSDDDDCEK